MKTSDLMDMLAMDKTPRDSGHLWRFFLLGFVVLVLESTALIFLGFGVRPDYLSAIKSFPVMAKQLTALYVLVALLPMIPLYFYPETSARGLALRIVPFFIAMCALWIYGFSQLGDGDLLQAVMGTTNLQCLIAVSVIALPVTTILLIGFRRGATGHPMVAGFLIGLIAGAASAFMYAFVCNEDNPLFYAVWYSLAIFIPALGGAVLGRFMLRY